MIEIINAHVVKAGVKLFSDFNLHIASDEHCVITGLNGSGKTILLEMIAGVTHLSKGELRFDFISGDTWDDRYADRKRKIHYIPTHAIHSLLRQDEFYYQQRYYGIGDEKSLKVWEILGSGLTSLKNLNIPKSLSIEPLLDIEVVKLSDGQLKKVLFLKGIAKEIPHVLLMDYPFEGLDHQSRSDLCEFIDFLAREYAMQIILVDNHHNLPRCINRTLTLEKFSFVKKEMVKQDTLDEVKIIPVDRPSVGQNLPVIDIKNIKIQYGTRIILQDFSWTVKKGERWALIGKNGAGKTTLLSMIFADHPMAYSQEIHLFGKRRGTGESIWDIKRRISYLGPELISYLNPKSISLSMRQYIESVNKTLNAKLLNEYITHFAAENFMDKPVRFLSSGELQIMLLINSLLSNRELLLLDEPFQFLDPNRKALVSKFLQSRLNEETTLVLVTHYEKDLSDWTSLTMKIQDDQ